MYYTDYTYDKDNRRKTETRPNGLVTTWSYDWRTMKVGSVLQERNTTSGDDITVSYTYDDNGQATAITDGRAYIWSKSYDAMGRMTTLTMPSGGGLPPSFTITYDGNNNRTKTVDFGGTTHYYAYDELNRMEGHGTTSGANDETYTWACCNRLTAYTDAQGTASLSYDDLARLTSHTDSNGNTVAYTYDDMSRIASITPASGANHKTEYTYKLNGSLSKVRIYTAAATYEDTDYTYNTTSGKLTSRNFPTVSSQYIKTAYAYDSAGRLEYETTTRETGSTTNLYRSQYAYSYIAAGSGGGNEVLRTEQTYSGGWVNDNKVNYRWNALGWMTLEQRHDWVSGAWSAVYDVNQEYDKNGNRTRYHKNVQGSTASYGQQYDLSYTFALRDKLTAITDADDANYSATVTCDANNNITQIDEQISGTQNNFLYTYFDYDALNRLTAHRTKAYSQSAVDWVWTKRVHAYDALGRVAESTYKQWNDGGVEPAGDDLEHVWDQRGAAVQNYDGTNYGAVWYWAGAENASGPLRSPNADTTAQTGYNSGNNTTPQRRTFLSPTSEGDKRNLWGQGRPMAKDSSGNGANWAVGTISQTQNGNQTQVDSRLFYEGTVAPTNMGRATDAREKSRVGIFGTALSYAGSYGRVTSESIGRDLNPLGRGDGRAYMAGAMRIGFLYPSLPYNQARTGFGNSVNNGSGGMGGGGFQVPYMPLAGQGCCKVAHWIGWQGWNDVYSFGCADNTCNPEEWGEDFERCHKIWCIATACGCDNAKRACLPGNCGYFYGCGCGKFGDCEINKCRPGYCEPGKFIPGGDGGGTPPTDGGGGGPEMCPGCGSGPRPVMGSFSGVDFNPLLGNITLRVGDIREEGTYSCRRDWISTLDKVCSCVQNITNKNSAGYSAFAAHILDGCNRRHKHFAWAKHNQCLQGEPAFVIRSLTRGTCNYHVCCKSWYSSKHSLFGVEASGITHTCYQMMVAAAKLAQCGANDMSGNLLFSKYNANNVKTLMEWIAQECCNCQFVEFSGEGII